MLEEYERKRSLWDTALVSNLNMLFVMLYRNCRECFPLSNLNRATDTILEIQEAAL